MEKKKLKKIIKIIILIIVILLLLLFIHTFRNFIIITKLQEKFSEYAAITNYSMKAIMNEKDGVTTTMDYYLKENRQVVFIQREQNGEKSEVAMYRNGEKTNIYTETKDEKTVQLNRGTILSVQLYNYLETDSRWQTFIGSVFAYITTSTVNGRDCYVIHNFMSFLTPSLDQQTVYIDKETGLFLKSEMDGMTTQREYKFNQVEDTIFKEPDSSQYTIKEN